MPATYSGAADAVAPRRRARHPSSVDSVPPVSRCLSGANMRLAAEVPRFVLVGIGMTGLHVVIATSLVMIAQLHPAIANGVAFAAATLVSYLSHTLWTFDSRLTRTSLARFLLVSLAGFVLTVAIAGAADLLGFPFYAGIGAVVLVVPSATFTMHKLWTYRI